MNVTRIYHRYTFERSEKLMSLKEYISLGRLEPGQRLQLGIKAGDDDNNYIIRESEYIWIGHATPYIQPTKTDGGIGWNFSDSFVKNHYVLSVHTF